MSRKIVTLSAVLVVVLAGAAGLVHAGTSGDSVAQVEDTPTETPETPTPDAETPTADEATPGGTDTSTDDGTAEPAGDNATISVTASARESASPDTAVVRLAVVATADEADAARSQVAADFEETRAALRDFGIDDDQIRTAGFDISVMQDRPRPVETADNGSNQIRASHVFEVEVGPNQTGAVIDTALGNGTNRVTGVTFTLTEDTRQDLREQALRQAMTNARSDAEVLASSEDVTITGLKSASTADVVFVPFESSGDVATEGAATAIEPGPVEVSASVSVTYRAN